MATANESNNIATGFWLGAGAASAAAGAEEEDDGPSAVCAAVDIFSEDSSLSVPEVAAAEVLAEVACVSSWIGTCVDVCCAIFSSPPFASTAGGADTQVATEGSDGDGLSLSAMVDNTYCFGTAILHSKAGSQAVEIHFLSQRPRGSNGWRRPLAL